MKVLLTGASGFLGAHLWARLALHHDVLATSRRAPARIPAGSRHLQGELEDPRLREDLAKQEPEVVVHLAALTDADLCEQSPRQAERCNTAVPEQLATALSRTCRRFVQVSTDLVFDGERGRYSESDAPHPLSVYGRTKLEGELAVRKVLGDRASIVRVALLYGPRADPGSRASFAERMIAKAAEGAEVPLFTDEIRSPLYVEDAALGLSRLIGLDRAPTLLHFGGEERLSRYELGVAGLEAFGLPADRARPVLLATSRTRAPRPRDASLDSALARRLRLAARGVRDGLVRMKHEMERPGFMVGS